MSINQVATPELAKKCVEAMLAKDAFSRWLGIELLETAPGYSKVKMTVRSEMLNGFGVSHGGIAFSLADSCFAFASNTYGQIAVSIEASISYPVAVKSGDVLVAEAKELSRSKRLGFYDIVVRRTEPDLNNVVVAIFRGTVFRTERELLGELK